MKVCIVGAGMAGLCAAKHALANNLEPTIFEQTENIGGTWQYTDEVGLNEYNIEVHTSMYKNLRTNLPKEVMGFPDYPIPDQKSSYISSKKILEFLQGYAKKFSVLQHVKFLHHVIRILPKDGGWEVTVKDLKTSEIKTEHFDFVLICNGHYHTPVMPQFEGADIFKGKQIHSHDYRSPEAFKGDEVLVVGAGPSGMDIAHSISEFAKVVLLSHHHKQKPKTVFRNNVIQKPDILHLTENGAYFTDNTFNTFNTILHCTGYKYAFPFLSTDCEIHVEDNFIRPLYKHCINIQYPTMAFIGLPFYVCASQMMDLQARFVMSFFCKKVPLPSKEEMLVDTEKDMQKRWEKGLQKRQAHMMGPFQKDYYQDLANCAGIENIKPVMSRLHNVSSQRFLDDLVNFRKDIFKIIDDTTFIKIN